MMEVMTGEARARSRVLTEARGVAGSVLFARSHGRRRLGDSLIGHIFSFLGRGDLSRLQDVCTLFRRCARQTQLTAFTAAEMVCYYTRRTLREGILGFGLNLEYYPGKRDNVRKLAYVSTKLELLSNYAYQVAGQRTSAYKQPFTHWLPLYLHPCHGETTRYRTLLKQALAAICNAEDVTPGAQEARGPEARWARYAEAWQSPEQIKRAKAAKAALEAKEAARRAAMPTHTKFDPSQALTVILKLLNTMVVNVMKV